jgi:hypothetical protein
MSENTEKKQPVARTILTNPAPVRVRRSGTSDVLGIPAAWLKAVPGLKGKPLLFAAVVERDEAGHLYIEFRRINPDEFNKLKL